MNSQSMLTHQSPMITPRCRQRWPALQGPLRNKTHLTRPNVDINRVEREDDVAQFIGPRVVYTLLLRISLPRCRRNAHICVRQHTWPNDCFSLTNNRHTKWRNYLKPNLRKTFREMMKKKNYVKIVEGTCKLKSHRYYTDIIGSYAKKHIVILKINEIIGLKSYQVSLGHKNTLNNNISYWLRHLLIVC